MAIDNARNSERKPKYNAEAKSRGAKDLERLAADLATSSSFSKRRPRMKTLAAPLASSAFAIMRPMPAEGLVRAPDKRLAGVSQGAYGTCRIQRR